MSHIYVCIYVKVQYKNVLRIDKKKTSPPKKIQEEKRQKKQFTEDI